jgi:hypothetical protein
MQLQDSAAHEGVRGQGVRAAASSFDDEHPQAGAGEQQGRRCAGYPAADDDYIPAPSSDSAEVKEC